MKLETDSILFSGFTWNWPKSYSDFKFYTQTRFCSKNWIVLLVTIDMPSYEEIRWDFVGCTKKWAVGILKCWYKRAEDVLIELLILIVDINILKMSQPHLNQSTKQCICISTEYWMSIRLSVWTAFWSENQMMTFDKIRNVDSTKI